MNLLCCNIIFIEIFEQMMMVSFEMCKDNNFSISNCAKEFCVTTTFSKIDN